jgi:hypothetical protein
VSYGHCLAASVVFFIDNGYSGMGHSDHYETLYSIASSYQEVMSDGDVHHLIRISEHMRVLHEKLIRSEAQVELLIKLLGIRNDDHVAKL